ncbi:MAG TPA: hypothetical protein HA360_00130 [Nanoarchaeota archaeon]|nr:hypothetical protein [Candidatus Woesearchaeota archaeon]HIH15334.1 hypothetical protein [Nanoarchaeota archaeon]HIH59224.1 hypothetical protein [Nanoarchaeota archaeon]HII13461.1 hypothetical protein [Nanoarchaeota archaeon]HIJ05550.1 hypothetical protein [Nanoarchaeota archaeon]
MREIADTNILKTFCEHFCSIVDKYCKYIIVSGYVAIASGRSRGTEDIDMIIEHIPLETFRKLHEELLKENFICVQDLEAEELYKDYLEEKTSIRYHKKEQYLPEMEIKFAKNPLDNYQIKTRQKIPFTQVDVWFSSIEMNIAFKEEYLKSEKDLEDAKHLRLIYKDQIDEEKISGIKLLIRKWKLN